LLDYEVFLILRIGVSMKAEAFLVIGFFLVAVPVISLIGIFLYFLLMPSREDPLEPVKYDRLPYLPP
jgi:hypothetical protein